jgi:CMP-N-acetylneuraminic acid synthetase
MLTVDDKGRLCSFLGSDKTFLPRQKLPEIYEFNGAVYVIKTETLLRTGDLVSENTLAYVMKKERSLDIDSLWDYRIAEALIEKKIKLESGHGTEI